MNGYKLILDGNDRRPFVCERCATGGEEVEFKSQRRGMRIRSVERQSGMCVSCNGSGRHTMDGRLTAQPCKECGGSGFCPECSGQCHRSWSELPLTAQQEFISRVETGDTDLLAFIEGQTLSSRYPY